VSLLALTLSSFSPLRLVRELPIAGLTGNQLFGFGEGSSSVSTLPRKEHK
jgi:hypothetical protein